MRVEKILKRDVVIRMTKTELFMYAQVYQNMHDYQSLYDAFFQKESHMPFIAQNFIADAEKILGEKIRNESGDTSNEVSSGKRIA